MPFDPKIGDYGEFQRPRLVMNQEDNRYYITYGDLDPIQWVDLLDHLRDMAVALEGHDAPAADAVREDYERLLAQAQREAQNDKSLAAVISPSS